jgi:hypothetical protein
MALMTRRAALAGAASLAVARRSSGQTTNWYVRPPSLLSVVRSDGTHVLDARMQRDRIVGTRTRAATQYGVVFDFARVKDKLAAPYAKFDDATYQALIAGNPTIFADCIVANSIGTEVSDSSSIALQNWGTHPQLCLMIGDSLMDSTPGSGLYPELLQPQNQCWAQPVVSKGNQYTTIANGIPYWNKSCGTIDPTLPFARICWKFAWDGWRLASLNGIKYPRTAAAHADQGADYQYVSALGTQKLDIVIQAGTNDQRYTGNTGVTLYGRPEQGRPNMVEDCLAPLIILLRAQLPTHMIGVMTPIARWWGDTAAMSTWGNAQFSTYADWLITPGNAPSIGVDAVWDSRTDPALDCRNAKQVTLNGAVYQGDRTHLMANGNVNHLGPGATALLDQFWST